MMARRIDTLGAVDNRHETTTTTPPPSPPSPQLAEDVYSSDGDYERDDYNGARSAL